MKADKLHEVFTSDKEDTHQDGWTHTLIDNCEKCPRSANIASEPERMSFVFSDHDTGRSNRYLFI